jgi:Set1/Ash2 histone methyltransferase complex subunit ASH2
MSDLKDSGGRGRGTKRKLENSAPGGKKSRGELSTPPLPPNGYPKEHPFNRDGYRYILAEPDPHAPFRQEFDESVEMAGKPIPGFLCRVMTPDTVLLALHDRAPQLNVSEDRTHVTGTKFYCSARATHSVSRGNWYFEVKLVDMPEGSATRIGWAQKNANLQAPLGFDKFGYSCRSRKGTKFHDSVGKHYSEGYGQGDILGCLIELPEDKGGSRDYLPPTFKDRPLIKFKSHLYYEEKDGLQENLKALKKCTGSKITFFKNGKSLGAAFEDIYAGEYHPGAGLFKHAHVKFNFGPRFKSPPQEVAVKFKPLCDRAKELEIEQAVADMRFFSENEGKLRIDNYFMTN